MKKFALIITTGTLLFACSPKTAEVVVVEESGFPSPVIAEGNKLYLDNCGKCHKLKTVTDYNEEQWSKILPKMAKMSKLDTIAESKIREYILWEIQAK